MTSIDFIRKFETALPLVREWIGETLAAHRDGAVPVNCMGWPRLGRLFPSNLLDRTTGVAVDADPPFPPLSRMGLPEFAAFEAMPINGVTYKNTFFVRRGRLSESLCFHEVVHVVQWERLGVDRFLLAYGIGLMQFGYEKSPLEAMAYNLQAAFDRNAPPDEPTVGIRRDTDAVWQSVVRILETLSPAAQRLARSAEAGGSRIA